MSVHSPSAHTHRATVNPVLVHELPLGSRVMRYGMGVTTLSGDLWWCRDRRVWTALDDNRGGLSSHAPCRTVKAFRRHLRRHSSALAGKLVIWAGRYGNVTADLTTTDGKGSSVGTSACASEPTTPGEGEGL